ncbi:MAG TPA: type IV pilus assembly protein PilM [Gemmataceae bacterium]|jgi:type IV pilus assembly protein PilM|nr:type IV pilus assembly protein PilM [Gemmataceae bacterium]
MAAQAGVWGIDIGQCALKALRLEIVEGVLTATAFDYIEHPKILSQPDADPDQLTREALETFLSRNSIKGDTIAISVPGQSGLARFVKLPPVEEKKIADIVRFEAKQQIPFPLEEVVWDYQKIGTGSVTDGFAMDTEIGLFAMKRDMISRYLHHFQGVNVEVHIVQMAPLALCNYVAYDLLKRNADGTNAEEIEDDDTPPTKKRCAVALDIGTDTSSLIITDGEKIIWQRPIPLGGNHVTRALTKEMKLTFAKAEHLKRNAAKSPDLAKILKALKPVLTDFVNEVQRSLGYFTNTHRDAHVAFMVGLGSAFRLPGLQKFLSEKLSLEVRKPTSFEKLRGDDVVSAPVFTENLLTFPVAYGLALQGLKQSRLSTNLLPAEIQFDRMIRAKKPWSVAAAAAILLGLGVLTLGFSYMTNALGNPVDYKNAPDSDQIAKAMKEADAAKGAAATQLSTASARQTEVDQTTRDVKFIIAGKDERYNWLRLHEFVGQCLPHADGSNLQYTQKQIMYWKNRNALEAFDQYRQRKLGQSNVVDVPMDDEALKNFVHVDIEGEFCMYTEDLKEYFNRAKAKSKEFNAELDGIDCLWSPENEKYLPAWFKSEAKKYSETPPEGAGWVVELRGSTYHYQHRAFLIDTLVYNLDRIGAMGMDRNPQKIANDTDPLRGKASHAFLYFSREVKDPQPNTFVYIDKTYLPEILSAGTGEGPGGPGQMPGMARGGIPGASGPGSGGADARPGGSGQTGAASGTPRSAWRPEGSVPGFEGSSGSSPFGGLATGSQRPGGGATASPGVLSPAQPGTGPAPTGDKGTAAEQPKSTGRQRIRYEFVVLLVWREPITSDTLTSK